MHKVKFSENGISAFFLLLLLRPSHVLKFPVYNTVLLTEVITLSRFQVLSQYTHKRELSLEMDVLITLTVIIIPLNMYVDIKTSCWVP